MTKRSLDTASALVMWAIFKAVGTIAVLFILLMLLADMLWIACPRFVEPLLHQAA
jgi:hypothetical protein